MTDSIDISPFDLEIVWHTLNKHLKLSVIKWVFGSRAKWMAKTYSDLDLALQDPYGKIIPFEIISGLKADFEESDLPWTVDIIDLNNVSEEFRNVIEKDKVRLPIYDLDDWPIVTLLKYCLKIGSGATPKGGKNVYLDNGEIRLVRSQNIYNDGFKHDGLVYICEEAANQLSNVSLEKDDILINITGDSVARVCQVDNSILPARVNQHVAIIRPDPLHFDNRYLRYFLASPKTQSLLLTLASAGATRNALTKRMLETLDIPKPPHFIQSYIGDVIEALDSKIELNRKINQTLESMAQAIFKSWFVDFDPVIDNALKAGNPIPEELQERAEKRAQLHQEGKAKALPKDIQALFPDRFVLSEEIGWVPVGWHLTKLEKLLEIKYGKDHKILDTGNIPVFDSGGLMRYANKSLYKGESVLIPRKGTLSNIIYLDQEFWTVDTMFYTIPKSELYPKYVYYHLKNLDFNSMNVGSAVPSMTTKVLNDLLTILPNEPVLKQFNKIIQSYFYKMKQAKLESDGLTKLREVLLPKLISGELCIPDAKARIQDKDLKNKRPW